MVDSTLLKMLTRILARRILIKEKVHFAYGLGMKCTNFFPILLVKEEEKRLLIYLHIIMVWRKRGMWMRNRLKFTSVYTFADSCILLCRILMVNWNTRMYWLYGNQSNRFRRNLGCKKMKLLHILQKQKKFFIHIDKNVPNLIEMTRY